jgi:hypothetical protein
MHSGVCAPGRDAPPQPCGRPWWPSGLESRGGACVPTCSADRSVSRKLPPLARSKMASCAHSAGRCCLAGDAPARRQSIGPRRRAIAAAYTGPLWRRQIRMNATFSARFRQRSLCDKPPASRQDRTAFCPAFWHRDEVEIRHLRCLSFVGDTRRQRLCPILKGIGPILEFIAVHYSADGPGTQRT